MTNFLKALDLYQLRFSTIWHRLGERSSELSTEQIQFDPMLINITLENAFKIMSTLYSIRISVRTWINTDFERH